jgi:hypothetical protein
MANEAIAFHNDAEEQCVVVAVGGSCNNAQPVAARFAFHPKLLPGAAPESHKAGFHGFGIACGVQKSQHKHLACLCVLHNARDEAIHFFEVDCRFCVAHSLLDRD